MSCLTLHSSELQQPSTPPQTLGVPLPSLYPSVSACRSFKNASSPSLSIVSATRIVKAYYYFTSFSLSFSLFLQIRLTDILLKNHPLMFHQLGEFLKCHFLLDSATCILLVLFSIVIPGFHITSCPIQPNTSFGLLIWSLIPASPLNFVSQTFFSSTDEGPGWQFQNSNSNTTPHPPSCTCYIFTGGDHRGIHAKYKVLNYLSPFLPFLFPSV